MTLYDLSIEIVLIFIHKKHVFIPTEEFGFLAITLDQVKEVAPITSQSSAHYELHGFVVAIRCQKQELSLVSHLLEDVSQLWLRYYESLRFFK